MFQQQIKSINEMDFEYPSNLSIEERQILLEAYESVKPKFEKPIGIVIINGTSRVVPSHSKTFRELWNTRK